MEEIERGFGPAAALIVAAAVTSCCYRQVQGFREAWIGGSPVGPLNHLLGDVVRRRARTLKRFPLPLSRCFLSRGNKEKRLNVAPGERDRSVNLAFLFAFCRLIRSAAPPVVAIGVLLRKWRASADADIDYGFESGSLQPGVDRGELLRGRSGGGKIRVEQR